MGSCKRVLLAEDDPRRSRMKTRKMKIAFATMMSLVVVGLAAARPPSAYIDCLEFRVVEKSADILPLVLGGEVDMQDRNIPAAGALPENQTKDGIVKPNFHNMN